MIKSAKEKLLIAGIVICAAFASERFYTMYKRHYPVGQVGECVKMTLDNGTRARATIMANNHLNGVSAIVLEVKIGNTSISIPMIVSYEEMREFHAEKVDCNANF